ncbi:hypothetical protein HYC85_016167, partial [Camellia sinensis]
LSFLPGTFCTEPWKQVEYPFAQAGKSTLERGFVFCMSARVEKATLERGPYLQQNLRNELVRKTTKKVALIHKRLIRAQSRQKSYADHGRRPLSFDVGDHVFLKISPRRGLMRFGKSVKLSPQFIGPFEILDRIGEVVYCPALPPQLSGVYDVFHISMLRKYKSDPSHVLEWTDLEVNEDTSYEERPVRVLDTRDQVLQGKTIPLVKFYGLGRYVVNVRASKSFSDSSLGGVSDQLPCVKKKHGFCLSVLIAMKATFLLLAFAYLRTLGFTLLSLPLLYASLVSMLLSIASHPLLNLPMLLGKNPNGTFPIWSLIMFSPYLYFVRGFSVLQRLWNGEAPYSEICEGLYVGGWPYSPEKLPPGNPAIVDCTCELPRNLEFLGHAYLCIPTWDTRAPQPHEIESAVWWACRKRAQKIPISIYCAYVYCINVFLSKG